MADTQPNPEVNTGLSGMATSNMDQSTPAWQFWLTGDLTTGW